MDERDGERTLQVISGYPTRLQGECAAICLVASSGSWTKTPLGTKHLSKDQVKHALRGWQSVAGEQRIEASLRTPLSSRTADEIVRTTTLTFVTAAPP